MNLILLEQEDFRPGSSVVRIQGRRLKHVLDVHRAGPGDELSVGLVNGRTGIGRVLRIDRSLLELEVSLRGVAPAPHAATLVLALPRPKVLRRVLRSAVSFGVKRIVLVNAARVEKSYWQTLFLAAESIREQCVLGLEQAKDTVLPEVLLRPLFKPFVEDELPQLTAGRLALVAHPAASAHLPHAVIEPVILAIGPEGGFVEYEIEKLAACGFQAVTLGSRILSVETAVPALLSRIG